MAIVQTSRLYNSQATPIPTANEPRLNGSTTKATALAKPKTSITFHQPWDPHSSIRQKELARAAQRSHSARVASERKKRGQQQRQATTRDRRDSHGTTVSPAGSHNANDVIQLSKQYIAFEEDEPRVAVDSITDQLVLVKTNQRLPKLTIHGNSDPFNSYVVEVNPEINRMIAFARQSFFPSLSTPPWLRKQGRTPEETLRFFELGRGTPDSTVAHLACYGAALLRILPSNSKHAFEKAWLQVRSQALQNLRRSLTQSGGEPLAISIIQQCLYLFQADIEVRFFNTAKIHAKTLRYLLEPLPPNPTTILLFLTSMHSVLETACLSLEPPVMTFDNWNPLMWHSIWTSAETTLTAFLPKNARELHPSLRFPFLRQTLLRLRLYFTMPSLSQSSAPGAEKDGATLWSVTRLVDDAAKLIAQFLQLKRTDRFVSSPETKIQKINNLWESTLTLTALCAIRHHAHSPFLDDTDIDLRDESYVIAPKLRQTTERLLSVLSDDEQVEQGEALYWVYFIGSMFEQRRSSYRRQILEAVDDDKGMGQGLWWFSERLVKHAKLLNLVNWADARVLLEQFAAYGERILEPDPDGWYDQIFDNGTHGH